jgi:hypothetical protein
MLSMEWLHKIGKNPREIPPEPFPFEKSLDDKVLAYYKQIAMNFLVYVKTFSNKTPVDSELDFTAFTSPNMSFLERDNRFINMCSSDINPPMSFTRSATATDLTTAEQVFSVPFNYCKCSITMDIGKHAVAFANILGKRYFFDPNYGVFNITETSTPMGDIFKLYKKTISEWCFSFN